MCGGPPEEPEPHLLARKPSATGAGGGGGRSSTTDLLPGKGGPPPEKAGSAGALGGGARGITGGGGGAAAVVRKKRVVRYSSDLPPPRSARPGGPHSSLDFSLVGSSVRSIAPGASDFSVRSVAPGARDRSVLGRRPSFGPSARDRSAVGAARLRLYDSSVRARASDPSHRAGSGARLATVSDTGLGGDVGEDDAALAPLPASPLALAAPPPARRAASFALGSSGGAMLGRSSSFSSEAVAVRQEMALRAATVFKMDGTLQEGKVTHRIVPNLGARGRVEEGSVRAMAAASRSSVNALPTVVEKGGGGPDDSPRLPLTPKSPKSRGSSFRASSTAAAAAGEGSALGALRTTPAPPRAVRSLQLQPSLAMRSAAAAGEAGSSFRGGIASPAGSRRGGALLLAAAGRQLDSSVRGAAERASQLDPSFRALAAASALGAPPPPRSASSLRAMAAGAQILRKAAAEGSVRGAPAVVTAAAAPAAAPLPPRRLQSMSSIGAGGGSRRGVPLSLTLGGGGAEGSVRPGSRRAGSGAGESVLGTPQKPPPATTAAAEDKASAGDAAARPPPLPHQRSIGGASARSSATRASGDSGRDFPHMVVTASPQAMRESVSGKLKAARRSAQRRGSTGSAGGGEAPAADPSQVSISLWADDDAECDHQPVSPVSPAVSPLAAPPAAARSSLGRGSSSGPGASVRIPSRRASSTDLDTMLFTRPDRTPSRGRLVLAAAAASSSRDMSVGDGDDGSLQVHPLRKASGAAGAGGAAAAVLRRLGSAVGRDRRRKTGPRGIFGCAP